MIALMALVILLMFGLSVLHTPGFLNIMFIVGVSLLMTMLLVIYWWLAIPVGVVAYVVWAGSDDPGA